jgi:hypothetical protein
LGLTASPAEYLTLTAQNWARPAQPPPGPVIPADATQYIIAEAQRHHRDVWEQYNLMLRTDNTLRNQLLASADDIYWRPLFQPITGYGRRTAREFIHHLTTTYAAFDESTRRSIVSAMEVAWNGGPFEIVIGQIEHGSLAFAQAGHAYNDQQKCDMIYTIVINSGLMPSACQKWRLRPSDEKTWAACIVHFQMYADDRANDTTAGSADYHTGQANMVENPATIAMMEAFSQQLANMAKPSDQYVLQLQADLAATKAQLTVFQDMTNTNRQRTEGRPTGADKRKNAKFYCHTHGHNNSHAGPDCNKPAADHKTAATATNPMGGKHHRPKQE